MRLSVVFPSLPRSWVSSRLSQSLMCGAAALTLVGGLLGGSPAAHAADPTVLARFGDWVAYSFEEKGGKVCYMASQPVKAEGDYTQRGDIYALVTHRPAAKSFNVISVVAGYPYKTDSDVDLSIGKKSWSLFTKGERAWARDSKTDKEISKVLRKGSSMVIKGKSQRGTLTTDTYSLRGSSAAFDAISKACNAPAD